MKLFGYAVVLLAALVGCSDFDNPLTGKLELKIIGLPSGSQAGITVASTGFTQVVNSDATLSGLQPGVYNVTTGVVTAGGSNFTSTPSSSTVTVAAGSSVSKTVTFARVIKGILSITVTGLPEATLANVLVTGPNGFSQAVTASQTLSDLAQGIYQVTANAFEGNFIGYTSSVNQSVVVTNGNTSTITAAYTVVYTNFADFADRVSITSTRQDGNFGNYRYGDPSSAATIDPIVLGSDTISTTYTLSPGAFGGATVFVNGKKDAALTDFTGYTTLRINLASSTRTQLQVKIGGNEPAVRDAGCYPVLVVNVTPTLTAYDLNIAEFAPRSFCGNAGRTIAQTISNVVAVEVEDNNLPSSGTITSTTTLSNVRFVK